MSFNVQYFQIHTLKAKALIFFIATTEHLVMQN